MRDLSVVQVQEALRAHAANGIDMRDMGPSGNFKFHGKPFLANMPELRFHGNNGDFSHLYVHAPVDEGGAKKISILSTSLAGSDSPGFKSVKFNIPMLDRYKTYNEYSHAGKYVGHSTHHTNSAYGDLIGHLDKHFLDYDNNPYDIHEMIDTFRKRGTHGLIAFANGSGEEPRSMTTEEHEEFRNAWLNHGRPLRASDASGLDDMPTGFHHLPTGFPTPYYHSPSAVIEKNGEHRWGELGGTVNDLPHNNIIVLNPKHGEVGMDHYVYTPHTEELHRLDV